VPTGTDAEATADQDGGPIIVVTGHYLASLLVLSIFLIAALAVLHQTVTAARSALLVTCGKPVSLGAGAAFYPAYVPPAGIFAWIGGIPAHLVTAASGTERARPELPFPRLWSCQPRARRGILVVGIERDAMGDSDSDYEFRCVAQVTAGGRR
jgi:hypothetical protein